MAFIVGARWHDCLATSKRRLELSAENRLVEKRHGLVVPVLLIGLGILFLLSNLGLLSWSIGELLARLWPILIIAVGLDVLIGHRSILGSIVVLFLVLGIVGISSMAISTWPIVSRWSTADMGLRNKEVSHPLENAKQADLQIGINIGTLRISDLTDSGNLVEGNLALSSGEELRNSYNMNGESASVVIRSQDVKALPFARSWGENRVWQLGLNSTVPMNLRISTGVGENDIDLARLKVTDFVLNTGVGKTTLVLPDQGQVQANINGGIGETTVLIPAGTAAQIKIKSGIGSVDVNGQYSLRNGTYTSPGFDSTENRVSLDIKGGIGKITVMGAGDQ